MIYSKLNVFNVLQDLADAIVNGLTTALLGKGVAVTGAIKILQLLVSWFSVLVPLDVITWLLGRELIVQDVIIVETVIQVMAKLLF